MENSTTPEFFDRVRLRQKTTLFVALEINNAILAILGNLIVFIVFFREKKLRRKINFYIISLAIADFCVGAIGIPSNTFAVITQVPKFYSDLLCIVPISFCITFSNVSIYSLVLISLKRLATLTRNLPQPKFKSNENIVKEVGICWAIGTFIAFLPVVWNDKETDSCVLTDVLAKSYIIFRFITVVLIPSIIIGVVYFKIYKIIIEHSRRKAHSGNTINKSEQRINKEIRTSISISLIVLVFYITWLPIQMIYVVTVFCDKCIDVWYIGLFICIAHFNSAINPLIYAYRMKDIRKSIFKLFGVKSSEIEQSSKNGMTPN